MKRPFYTSAIALLLSTLIITSGCASTGNALFNSEQPDTSSQTVSEDASSVTEDASVPESSIPSSSEEGSDTVSEESRTSPGHKSNNKPAPESKSETSAESPADDSYEAIEESPEGSSEIITEDTLPETTDVILPVQQPETASEFVIESSYETGQESSAPAESPESITIPAAVTPESSTAPADDKTESSLVQEESIPVKTQSITASDLEILQGKKLGAVGDSVVFGHREKGFAELIAEDHNMTLQNLAVNGATIARDIPYKGNTEKNRKCIPDMAQQLDNDCDLIVTDGGYNDFVNDVPLGELTEGGNVPDPYTFYGGLERLCRTLVFKHPKDGILFVITHRVKHSDNSLGLNFADYRFAILRVCAKYDINVLDLYAGEPTQLYFENNKTEGIYTQLGQGNIHPTEKGYREYYLPGIEERFYYMTKE